LKSIGCKNDWKKCYGYLTTFLKNNNFRPCMLVKKGGQKYFQRGMSPSMYRTALYGESYYRSDSSKYAMMGEFMMQANGKFEHQGATWNFKASGMQLFKMFKKHYMFYVFHTRNENNKRKTWTWRYWTNNFERTLAWYNNKSQFWRKKVPKKFATGIFIKTAKGFRVVKLESTSDY